MDVVFNKKWFEQHQRKLLWLLNNPLTKRWFRWCLRIRKYDCKLDVPINRILPNCFSYGAKVVGKKIQFTTDFRTHDKYSKRLYCAFKPLWYVLHVFDWAMLDRVETLTKLSFGFSTLTQYPGSTGANDPVDGNVGRLGKDETFATIRAGAGTNAATSNSFNNIRLIATATTDQYERIERGIICFDTSLLGAGATISSAVLSLWGNGKSNGLGSDDLHICASTPASTTTLATSDYGNLGSTSFGSIAYASYSITAYNGFTLNASGLSAISKTGISKFGTRIGWDLNNSFTGTWASGGATRLAYRGDDADGTANDPKIVVTGTGFPDYPAVEGGHFLSLLGVGT